MQGIRSAALLVGCVFVTISCAQNRPGGMTIQQAFPDPRVAALVEAVSDGNYAEADRQLKAGADVNCIGTDGVSPLMWVIGTTLSVKATEYMLKAGADPNYRDSKHQRSAIHLTAGGNRPDLLELLLKYNGNPSLPGKNGDLPLYTALFQERDENIRILVAHGAAMHYESPSSESVANTAIRLGRYDLAVFFLEHGLNHNLDGLAVTVFRTRIPKDSKNQPLKEKVIEILKSRGVKYPPEGRR